MNDWFICKVIYPKMQEDGTMKKATNEYLVEGSTFTDAENLVGEKMIENISGDFIVEAVKKEKVAEVFESEVGGYWFKFKVVLTILDEESGREKKKITPVYLQTLDIKTAIPELMEKMKDSVSDYRIQSVVETKILDIFRIEEKETKE